MKGNIIGFDPDTNTGAISGHDGNRYDFTTTDWRGRGQPRHGDVVDFQPDGQHATQIYLLEPEYVAPTFGQLYFSPKGRVSRSQYWLKFILPVFVISLILGVLKAINGEATTNKGPFSTIAVIFQLGLLWPGIAILIKRIHDRNKTGWLVWLLYGPLIVAFIFTIAAIVVFFASDESAAWGPGIIAGLAWLVVLVVSIWFFVEFGCLRGTIGANRFGPDSVPPL
jgi:uncharacterized membrane protein YhaH (DUF805 family)